MCMLYNSSSFTKNKLLSIFYTNLYLYSTLILTFEDNKKYIKYYIHNSILLFYTLYSFLLKKKIKNKKFNIYIFREIVYIRSKSDGSIVRNCENERIR